PMLLAAGRLTEQKGYFDLLNAIVLLRQSFPYVQLFIAGGGHLYSDLVQETERLGLSENISFLGIRDDVLKLMTASDIFVNSSHWEGMPVSILEAMAAGKAIVATQVGDVPRIGKDKETMLLVEPKHPEKIAAAIKLLLTNQMLKESIGPRAKQEVEKNFSAKSWAEKLFNIYLEVSGK
ncbi:MAG: glycosyltransferase involved in cell wall biosynthesis, partial [Cellvibrionaceae bacterium]